MILPKRTSGRRCGVTTVETAMVMLPLLLTMFSIFEYGRFVMVRQLLDLATELGCRYAIAHNQDSTIITAVQAQVNTYMAGMNNTTQFSAPLVVTVYQIPTSTWDPTLVTVTTTSWTVVPPSNASLTGSGSPTTLAAINSIKPGDPIAVGAVGNFKMMFPTLLYVSPTIPMNSMVILTCEGT
jgi:Flp pilus assembly protein TadG